MLCRSGHSAAGRAGDPRMIRGTSFLLVGLYIGVLTSSTTIAQDRAERPNLDERLANRPSDDDEGFGVMLSPAVMEKLLDRIVDKMGKDLQFDEAQTEDARRVFKENVLTFMKQNQKEFTKLTNDFLDKRLGTEAP